MITYNPDKEKWNKLLRDNKSSIFQTIEWANVIDGWTPVYLINDDWSGGMVLLQRKDKLAYESMYGGCYGGYIGKKVDLNQLIFPEMNYIRVVDYYDQMNLHWEKKMVSTYLLDLKNYKISHGIKDNLRIANKNNVKVKETDDIDLFYKVYKESYKNFDQRVVYEKEYFQKIKDTVNSKFYIAYYKNKPISIALQLFYKDEIFNLYNACIEKYKHLNSISLIMSKVIEENKNYSVYNLGAATTEGGHYFKSKWGAKKYDYPIYGKIINYIYYES